MKSQSESRAAVAFTGLGVVLVALAVGTSHLFPKKSGADALPEAEKSPPPPLPHATEEAHASAPGPQPPRMFQRPTLSATQIAFDFAGEIWTVARDGGEARRLVTGQLRNSNPVFSPDGSEIAFTGVLDDNADVYVVPAAGGQPRRLTYFPGGDAVVGWTPDGKEVLFRSSRSIERDLPKLFTVKRTGGFPTPLPLPSGVRASYSPDGKQLAYVPFPQSQPDWRKYRGGQTTPIWIADLSDSHVTKVPHDNVNDRSPTWLDHTVYFLSDRDGPYALYGYDVASKAVKPLVKNPDGFDMANASAGPGGVVYDQMGDIHLYDVAKGAEHLVPITVSAELPQTRPRFERVAPHQVLHAALSPTGKRVLLETRGEILSAPVEKGDVRNLTRTPGAADRDPAWSPDGKWVAWLSDESGEYELFLRSPDGLGPLKKVSLGTLPSYFYSPRWSPDSKKLILSDKRLNLWLIDLDNPTPVKIDTDRFEGARFDPSWSPDSRFVAYTKTLASAVHAVFIYALEDKKSAQVTDGRSEAASPRFDRDGKNLWFVASTDSGPSSAGGMVSMGRPQTSSVYGIVLQKDGKSPMASESDEEGDAGTGKSGDKSKADDGHKGDGDKPGSAHVKDVRIDFENIDQRIVALPIDRANYVDLQVGEKGVLFVLSGPIVFSDEDHEGFDDGGPPIEVKRFDLATRKTESFLSKVDAGLDGGGATFILSADGKKVLYRNDEKWFVVSSDKAPKAGDGTLKLDGAEVWVDPPAEWRQIYHEVWRIERDFLYDPHFHGLDLAATEKLYSRYLDGIADRDNLNDVLAAGLSNLVLGHVWARGGSLPRQPHVGGGLLGVDYVIEQGHYRIARILRGENWNPKVRAPLTEPGVNVKEGDFLLAVNGEPLSGDDDVNRLFLERAGKQTVITVSADANGGGSHDVTVVPTGSETSLRLRTWMEGNKKKVDQLSGGRVAYVYLPDTQGEGLTNFNRYYYSQAGKDAVVIDERFNHGGQLADYIVEVLGRKVLMGATTREGEDQTLPQQAIFGPKVMLANQSSGSGGDALPWLFKQAKLGPVVGTRTWGGLVGIGGYPRLMDGGRITAPRWALYGVNGEWEVENHGIAPDVEVEQDPALMRQGHDPQLERAVEIAMAALAKDPPKKLTRPAYPNYGDRLPKLPK